MRGATGVHIDLRAFFGESPRRARVIKMNVAQKNVADVFWLKARLSKIANYIVEGRFGSGIE